MPETAIETVVMAVVSGGQGHAATLRAREGEVSVFLRCQRT